MRKCEKCGHGEWFVQYDSVQVVCETSMFCVVKDPEDVGDYEDASLDITSENVPSEIDTTYSGIVVSCDKCGWEIEPDTEEALSEWLANEDEEEGI